MGFFNDLKADIAQAYNELTDENAEKEMALEESRLKEEIAQMEYDENNESEFGFEYETPNEEIVIDDDYMKEMLGESLFNDLADSKWDDANFGKLPNDSDSETLTDPDNDDVDLSDLEKQFMEQLETMGEFSEAPVEFNDTAFENRIDTTEFLAAVNELNEEPVIGEEVIEEDPVEIAAVEEEKIEEAVAEEPVIEESVIEEPVIEEPVIEEPVIEEPVVEEVVEDTPVIPVAIIEETSNVEENTMVIDNTISNETVNETSEERRVAIDETSVITQGLTIKGNLESNGNVEILGTIEGDIDCLGKLNVAGTIIGNSKASEVFCDAAKITGEICASGTVKVGQSSVIIGNVIATSAVIAGAVKGDIDVKGPVILDASAIVMGNIKSKSVQINNGAVIDGKCSQVYAEVNPVAFFENL